MLKNLFFILFLFFSFSDAKMFQTVSRSEATIIQTGETKNYCPNCGMNLIKFYKTNHAHEDHQYCSIHCLYEATKGNIPADAKVVDTNSLKFIDAKDAFYVVGSKIKGTMSGVSKYAFSAKEDAVAFINDNGGEIMTFAEAYSMAGKDFGQEVSKEEQKKKKEDAYKVGKKLYEDKCPKVNLIYITTIEELEYELKKSCSTNDEKQIESIKNYVWDIEKTSTTRSTALNKIHVPKDAKCPVCGMFVAKYPNWAAAIETNDKTYYFDGVKDMLKYIYSTKGSYEKVFVTDYYRLYKINAKDAYYVIGSNVYGPMGTELIPFFSEDEANMFLREHNGNRVITFDEIDEYLVNNL